ncbi:MAG: glycosyl hydrolase [Acidobacteria bacterium]|nr:glycosyl hydrolase [Acidobacteriota bacterium]
MFVALASLIALGALVALLSVVGSRRTRDEDDRSAAAGYLTHVDPGLFKALEWRSIGPHRGGRVSAVAGDPRNPLVFYFGANGGGVFKTIDGGTYWEPVSDGFFKTGPVGAIAVAESDPNVIYAGMGDTCMRPDLASGDGVYKSADGGKTWIHLGLQPTRHIARIRIHPQDPDLVYVAAFGHVFGPNPERGVYRSKNGGKTWERVLFKSERAGAIDLTMDPTNPRVLYASVWQFVRTPWDEISGGPDSGLYKTSDGGDTWVDIGNRPGLPKGIKGRIGVAVSPAKPTRVWALVEAEDGAFFRSDDSGATWQRINEERYLRALPHSYSHVIAHPKNADIVYVMSYDFFESRDGGKTFVQLPTPHGDNHDLWIDPRSPDRMIQGNDGGANVTYNGGVTWSTIYNQPTAAIYHIAVDNQFPYRVYGTQQDNSAISTPSRTNGAAIGLEDSYSVSAAESGHIVVRPDDPNIVFAGSIGSSPGGVGAFRRYDHRSRQDRVMTIWPDDQYSSDAVKDLRYRFRWDFPVILSPHDPNALYVAANKVFKSMDQGQSWEVISPDLTRNDTSKMQEIAGGPITTTAFGWTISSVIAALAESPVHAGELWAGTDDGLVRLSRDGGKSWTDISSKEWPAWLKASAIEVSRHQAGTAYLAAHRYLVDDHTPYFYRTRDYGQTWRKMANGIREGDFARVLREDPVRPGLLYAGTETGVYVSFDDGDSWQALQLNLPAVSVRDLVVKGQDLVIGTHSRSFWILDDISPLREISLQIHQSSTHLFTVTPAYRFLPIKSFSSGAQERGNVVDDALGKGKLPQIRDDPRVNITRYDRSGILGVAVRDVRTAHGGSRRVFLDAGQNPPDGVVVSYYFKEKPAGPVVLTFRDGKGQAIRSFSSEPSQAVGRPVPVQAGLNRFVWDMRYPNARQLSPEVVLTSQQWPRASAPVAPPGQYRVQLVADGRTLEQPFEIRKDPRLSASHADLEAQFALWIQLRDKLSETTDTVNRLRAVRQQVDERVRRLGQEATAADLNRAAARIKAKLATIEARLTRVVGPNPMRLPPKGVHQRLATLANVIDSADGRPTRWTYSVFEELSGRLAEEANGLSQTADSDVTEFLRRTETMVSSGR